jgi:chemotaxis protein methyltransferase CheR
MALADADFQFVAREAKARTGLMLTPDKAHLLEMRLTPIARREGFLSVPELITTARARQDDRLLWMIADTLTINETSFFRDRATFTMLRDQLLPSLARVRGAGRALRLLCAGCSTGQEPYSIAMTLDDMRAGGRGVDCEIVAIDVSERILEKARSGLYSQFEVQRGLPISLLVRHFEKAGDMWRASDRVRAAVKFQKANLLGDLAALGRFDVILCRNVLIYFDEETRAAALARLSGALEPDGYLILGAAETIDAAHFTPAPDIRGALIRTPAARAAA